jgi:Fe-S-cluster containining protein
MTEQEKTKEEMTNEISVMLGLTKEQTQKILQEGLEKYNSLPVEKRKDYVEKVINSYLVKKIVENDLKMERAMGRITKEDKFIAISNYPNVKLTKELQEEIKKDRRVWDGLTNQILKRVESECKHCGWCCKLNKAQVTQLEIARIRKFLGIDVGEFEQKYVERRPGGTYFHAPCLFLDENNHCKIYPVRPDVCKVFPISFYRMTIGNCHIGNYLCNLNEEWSRAMSEKLGMIDDVMKPEADDELLKAVENNENRSMHSMGKNYDESDRSCRFAVIDGESLALTLELIKRKSVKPLNQYNIKELRDMGLKSMHE